jgi:hypothetical protein
VCRRITCAEMRVFPSWRGRNALLQAPRCGRTPQIGVGSIRLSRRWPKSFARDRIIKVITRLQEEHYCGKYYVGPN